jgi:hypothetical protein
VPLAKSCETGLSECGNLAPVRHLEASFREEDFSGLGIGLAVIFSISDMHLYLEPISLFVNVLFVGFVTWNWVRWLRPGEKKFQAWRTVAIAIGLCFATISSILSEFLYIHAIFTGGYPLFDPVGLFCLRIGTLASLLGLATALVGNGKLRLSIAAISIFNLLLWFVEAMAQ